MQPVAIAPQLPTQGVVHYKVEYVTRHDKRQPRRRPRKLMNLTIDWSTGQVTWVPNTEDAENHQIVATPAGSGWQLERSSGKTFAYTVAEASARHLVIKTYDITTPHYRHCTTEEYSAV
jgi:hypothetical protein